MGNTQGGLDETNCNDSYPNKHSKLLVSGKEIRKLYKRFQKLDTDRSGELEPEEFFDVPGLFFEKTCINIKPKSLHRIH